MSEVIDFYQQHINQTRSTLDWVAEIQANAALDFAAFGLPNRHDEDWRYSPPDALLKHRFAPAAMTVTPSISSAMTATHFTPYQVVLTDGIICQMPPLPAGVIVQPLIQAMVEHPDKVKPYLGKILQHEHGFQALNTAMLQQGLLIYVPAGMELQAPLWLTHWQTATEQVIYLRHLVVLEAGSQMTLMEDYYGEAQQCYWTNAVTEIALAEKAQLQHYQLQRESQSAFHWSHLNVQQTNGSVFANHLLNLGGKWVRTDATIYLQQPQAQCVLNGLYTPRDGQHMDQHTAIYHDVPKCRSEQDYKGVLSGHSCAVFNGKVMVAKDAQQTEAIQQNKNLLLSTAAEINTKPQLDIYADDVICRHGATVGQLDEEALFYLATRGIDNAVASQYLVQAFVANNLQLMANSSLASWFETLLNQNLSAQSIGSCHA